MRISICLVMCILLVATAAHAQETKFELMGTIGYSFDDGIDIAGEDVTLPDGTDAYFNQIDVGDGMYYGLGGALYVSRNFQVGFMWDYQQSEYVATGSQDYSIADMGIDNYHALFIYNMGSPLDKVRPIFYGGLGATGFRGFDYETPAGDSMSTDGETVFSTTWGAGAKVTLSSRFALQLEMKWTPTYAKSEADGYWCDPYYGCYTTSDADYIHQFKLGGTLIARF